MLDVVSGERRGEFRRQHGRTQRRRDVADGLLRIRRVLDAQPDHLLRRHDPPSRRLLGMVLPLQRRAGVRQQLRQPVHLRRQVPRVPGGRQAHAAETDRRSSDAAQQHLQMTD